LNLESTVLGRKGKRRKKSDRGQAAIAKPLTFEKKNPFVPKEGEKEVKRGNDGSPDKGEKRCILAYATLAPSRNS